MAYSERIKNFNRIRGYMREFFVYGFKSREEMDLKSLRSYDDERRRIEGYLDGYMGFERTREGKNVFISVDSRAVRHNPFYNAFKAKSFTDKDIVFHFLLMDLLSSPSTCLPVKEITDRLDREYLSGLESPLFFDESTIRKKLQEYVGLGLLRTEKRGRQLFYRREAETDLTGFSDAVAFFSEAAPVGVVGSYLLDRLPRERGIFTFKHHYFTHALESEVLCLLLEAIHAGRQVTFSCAGPHLRSSLITAVPLRIFLSVQNGRQYLMAWDRSARRIRPFRLDLLDGVVLGKAASDFDPLREKLAALSEHIWGVSCHRADRPPGKLSFTLKIGEGEEHIFHRLEREKRCGRVTRLSPDTCRFEAEVYDANELFPFIRSFICRITEISFPTPALKARFMADLEEMYRLYGVGGEES